MSCSSRAHEFQMVSLPKIALNRLKNIGQCEQIPLDDMYELGIIKRRDALELTAAYQDCGLSGELVDQDMIHRLVERYEELHP
jgi:hypothetical protein